MARGPLRPAIRGTWLATVALAAALLLPSCSESGSDAPGGRSPHPPGAAPLAFIDASATQGEVPLDVVLDGSASSDPDGDIVTFEWNFGDGSPRAHGEAVRHVYRAPGSYRVRLTVLDDDGKPGEAEETIAVVEAVCPSFAAGVSVGAVESGLLVETSGIAASRKNPGVLWAHNDSGDSTRIFALSSTGVHLGTYAIEGASAQDWEDMAVGPGPDPGESYVYIGDIGDNARARSHVTVYRIPEPVVAIGGPPESRTIGGTVAFQLTYPEGPSDAECLLVDPVTRDVLIVTKRSDGASRIFRSSYPQDPGTRASMDLIGTLAFGSGPLSGSTLVTGGDISPLGNWILLRTYSSAYLWLRGAGDTVGEAMARDPCPLPVVSEPQGEAGCFAADSSAWFTVSEGVHPPLHRFDRVDPDGQR